MGDLAAAAGLGGGADAQKKLVKMMEKGEIGIDILLKFIEIVKKKAIDTGAYSARINSIQAAESRMNDAFTYFSDSLIVQLDESIKSSFSGVTKLFEKMTAYFDEQNRIQKETGEVGTFKTVMDFLWQGVKEFGSLLVFAAESVAEVLSWLPLPGAKAAMQEYLARKQIEAGYFEKMGAKTEKDQWGIRLAGMQGFNEYAKEQMYLGDPFNTEKDLPGFLKGVGMAPVFSPADMSMIGGANLVVQSQLSSLANIAPQLRSLVDAFTSGTKQQTPTTVAPVFNITGFTDPFAISTAVEDKMNQLLIYPR